MIFQDILNFLKKQAESLEIKTVIIDHREITLLGDTRVYGDEESINKERYFNYNLFLSLLTKLNLSLSDEIDKHSPLNNYTMLHQTIIDGAIDLTKILLDHSANPLIKGGENNDENAILLAAKLNRHNVLSEFGSMVKQDYAAASNAVTTEADPEKENGIRQDHSTLAKRKLTEQDLETESTGYHITPSVFNNQHNVPVIANRHELTHADLIETTQYLIEYAKTKNIPVKIKSLPESGDILAHYKEIIESFSSEEKRQLQKDQQEQVSSKIISDDDHKRKLLKNAEYAAFFEGYKYYFYISGDKIIARNIPDNKPELNVFPDSEDFSNVILPHDRETAAAAIGLIADYASYQLTHPKRRYRNEASELVKPYLTADLKITNPKEFLKFCQAVKAEHEIISHQIHHGNVKNNSYNSTYCGLLEFILYRLGKTDVVTRHQAGHNNDYLQFIQDFHYAANLKAELSPPKLSPALKGMQLSHYGVIASSTGLLTEEQFKAIQHPEHLAALLTPYGLVALSKGLDIKTLGEKSLVNVKAEIMNFCHKKIPTDSTNKKLIGALKTLPEKDANIIAADISAKIIELTGSVTALFKGQPKTKDFTAGIDAAFEKLDELYFFHSTYFPMPIHFQEPWQLTQVKIMILQNAFAAITKPLNDPDVTGISFAPVSELSANNIQNIQAAKVICTSLIDKYLHQLNPVKESILKKIDTTNLSDAEYALQMNPVKEAILKLRELTTENRYSILHFENPNRASFFKPAPASTLPASRLLITLALTSLAERKVEQTENTADKASKRAIS